MKLISKNVVSNRVVYDLSIKDNHNYEITNSNIIVHNSGKGFILKNLLGIDGKVIDVDAIKELSLMTPKIIALAKDKNVDLSKINMKIPDDVYKLHTILDQLGIIDKYKRNLYTSILASNNELKPNLIFDVTLKDIGKFHNIVQKAANLGYPKENIHLVWVINDFDTAVIQNKSRSRVVPEDILKSTHIGASITMQELVTNMNSYRKYMDGDVVFVFNKSGVDSNIIKSDKGGSYVKDSKYYYIKRKNKPAQTIAEIGKDLISKIVDYTPKPKSWKDELDHILDKDK